MNNRVEPKWEDMDRNILLKIFATFSLMDLVLNVSSVCNSWRSACHDNILWKTLDLTELNNFINIPFTRLAWSDDQSTERFWRILRHFLDLSDGNFSTVIFHLSITITDEHLVYTTSRAHIDKHPGYAKGNWCREWDEKISTIERYIFFGRCPNLRKLVLPGWNLLSPQGFRRAFNVLQNVESLVIPSHTIAPHTVIQIIGESFKTLLNLKFRCLQFDLYCAATFLKYYPKLKALSLKYSLIKRDAIEFLLDNMESLEELNISHCHMDGVNDPQIVQAEQPIYATIIRKASRLRQFCICKTDNCVECRDEFFPHPGSILTWQELWRTDEISALAY